MHLQYVSVRISGPLVQILFNDPTGQRCFTWYVVIGHFCLKMCVGPSLVDEVLKVPALFLPKTLLCKSDEYPGKAQVTRSMHS